MNAKAMGRATRQWSPAKFSNLRTIVGSFVWPFIGTVCDAKYLTLGSTFDFSLNFLYGHRS